jgi:hypothetical protein
VGMCWSPCSVHDSLSALRLCTGGRDRGNPTCCTLFRLFVAGKKGFVVSVICRDVCILVRLYGPCLLFIILKYEAYEAEWRSLKGFILKRFVHILYCMLPEMRHRHTGHTLEEFCAYLVIFVSCMLPRIRHGRTGSFGVWAMFATAHLATSLSSYP